MRGEPASQIQPWTMQSRARALVTCFVQEAVPLLGVPHLPVHCTSSTHWQIATNLCKTVLLHEMLIVNALISTGKA